MRKEEKIKKQRGDRQESVINQKSKKQKLERERVTWTGDGNDRKQSQNGEITKE